MMKNYVISLKNQTKRREHIQKQFSQQGIPFEFFDAVTPDKVEELIKRFNIPVSNSNVLTGGEWGCLLSHVCLWQKIVDNNLPYMGIFEDDIHLGKGADLLLQDGLWLPEDFDILRLEKYHHEVYCASRATYSYKEYNFYRLLEAEWGTGGYIISYKFAKFLLGYIKSQSAIKPVDCILFEELITYRKKRVLQINPAICIQDDQLNVDNVQFSSDIQEERAKRHRNQVGQTINQIKKKLPLYRKIIREIIRVLKQIVSLPRNLYVFLYKQFYSPHWQKITFNPYK